MELKSFKLVLNVKMKFWKKKKAYVPLCLQGWNLNFHTKAYILLKGIVEFIVKWNENTKLFQRQSQSL